MSTWLITGCSTGLGRALAQAVLARGDNVVVTARDVAAGRRTSPTPTRTRRSRWPSTSPTTSRWPRRSPRPRQRFGGVDVLVNNAGYGYRAAVEEGEDADVAQLFATNFFGAVATIKAVLPGMRARRSRRDREHLLDRRADLPAGSGYYAATKAALEAMTASLRKEVAPLGITAMVVEPGGVPHRLRRPLAAPSRPSRSPTTPTRPASAARRTTPSTAPSPATPPRRRAAIIEAVESPRAARPAAARRGRARRLPRRARRAAGRAGRLGERQPQHRLLGRCQRTNTSLKVVGARPMGSLIRPFGGPRDQPGVQSPELPELRPPKLSTPTAAERARFDVPAARAAEAKPSTVYGDSDAVQAGIHLSRAYELAAKRQTGSVPQDLLWASTGPGRTSDGAA